MREVIGSQEAATILGVDRATFNRWAARGDLPVEYEGHGVSGARLFKRSNVEQLAKERRNLEQLAKARTDAKRANAKTDIPLSGLDVHGGDKLKTA